MSEVAPVLVFGATGVTGRHCVAALEASGAPYLVGGRREGALREVAGPGCVGVRVADAGSVGGVLEGVGCVLSTVGPFARYGAAVLDAAIQAGVPYTDTAAERTWVAEALERDPAARAAGVAVLPACGVEYLPMLLLAELLGGGPTETWLWLDDFVPTRGSVRSMVAMAGEGPTPRPKRHVSGDRVGWNVTIPGAESLLVHPGCRTHLMLGRWESKPFRVMWPLARRVDLSRVGDWIADRLADPSPEVQGADRFTVIVSSGDRALRVDGENVYRTTGVYAAAVAAELARGHATEAGVLSAGRALDPDTLLASVGLVPRSCEVPRR